MSDDTAGVTVACAPVSIWFVDAVASYDALQVWDDKTQAVDRATRDRINTIKSSKDRQTRFALHRALRVLIDCRAGPRWRGVPLHYAPDGRPTLEGSGVSFSMSHTTQAGLIAIGSDARLGVDLEVRERTIRMPSWRQQALVSAAKQLHLSRHGQTRDTLTFLDAWVRLEAYAKASGTGLGPLVTEALRSARVGDGQAAGTGHETPVRPSTTGPRPSASTDADTIVVYDLDVRSDYTAALATAAPSPALGVTSFPTTLTAIEALGPR